MRISALPSVIVSGHRTDAPRRTVERLPLRVSLPLIFLASASLWWGVWRGVSAIF